MKDLKFEKPNTTIEAIDESNTYGKFVVSPLERGYGMTLGNSLRRILLSSLPGAAIINTEIDGVEHEFSSIEGVVEVTVTLRVIDRVRSLILRFEGVDKRWVCTELKLL